MRKPISSPQTTFGSGEFGPYMESRSDLPDYFRSAKTLENWLVLPHGPIKRRPGFRNILKTSGSVDADSSRFVKFSFNTDQQYILLFSDIELRILRNDVIVDLITSPYTSNHIADIRYTHSGDTIIFTHPEYPVKRLTRNGADNDWTFSNITFTELPFYRFNRTVTITPSAVTGTGVTFTASDDYFSAAWVGRKFRINGGTVTVTAYTSATVIEGTIGDVDLTGTDASNAFEEWAWSSSKGYPRTCIFFQDRLVFGGTRALPGIIFGSNVSDYYNFADKVKNATTDVYEVTDSTAYTFNLTSTEQQSIKDLKAQQNLFVFSTEAESVVTGGGDNPITATNVRAATQSTNGINNLPVIDVQGELIFSTRNNKEIRSFVYDYTNDRFNALNKTIFAHHLFVDGKAPIDMAFMRGFKDTQANLLFVVRADGEIAVCTIDQEKNVLGWSRFKTNGLFKRVIVVSADHGDGLKETLYALIERDNGTFLEYLTEEDVFLDCHYVLTSGTAKTNWTGVTGLSGETCSVLADGLVHADTAVNGSGAFELVETAYTVHIGHEYTSLVETQDIVISIENQIKRVDDIRKVRARVELLDTKSLTVDGYPVPLRRLGDDLLDEPLPSFTGLASVTLGGSGYRSPTLTLSVSSPLPCTIASIVTDIKLRDN